MPTIAVVEDDRNILTSASMALETGGVRDRHICGRLLSSRRFEIKSAGSSPAGLDRVLQIRAEGSLRSGPLVVNRVEPFRFLTCWRYLRYLSLHFREQKKVHPLKVMSWCRTIPNGPKHWWHLIPPPDNRRCFRANQRTSTLKMTELVQIENPVLAWRPTLRLSKTPPKQSANLDRVRKLAQAILRAWPWAQDSNALL